MVPNGIGSKNVERQPIYRYRRLYCRGHIDLPKSRTEFSGPQRVFLAALAILLIRMRTAESVFDR